MKWKVIRKRSRKIWKRIESIEDYGNVKSRIWIENEIVFSCHNIDYFSLTEASKILLPLPVILIHLSLTLSILLSKWNATPCSSCCLKASFSYFQYVFPSPSPSSCYFNFSLSFFSIPYIFQAYSVVHIHYLKVL